MGNQSPILAALGFILALMPAAAAEEIDNEPNPKFRLNGNRLVFDTQNLPEGSEQTIENGDAADLFNLLQSNSNIRILELNSTGGSNWAASQMARIAIDFGLDTHVNGVCESSCTRVFLAGSDRSMSMGSQIGFHQWWWSVPNVKSYYESSAEGEGWDTPFEFASWLYGDTQSEIYEQLSYMVDRGVNPNFAIETLRTSADDMWYPYRVRLVAAGVITK